MSTYDDERIQSILRGRRSVRAYPLPFAPEVQVGVRALADQEIDDARLEAQRYCESRGAKMEIDPDFLERESRRQMLWRALTDPKDAERPFFPSDKHVRQLDAELIRALFDLYLEHQVYVSPLRSLDEAGVRELAETLGKESTTRAFLADCDSDTLRGLCLTLARAVLSS